MILLPENGHCFEEIDAAVRAMTDRVVAFNAHRAEAPEGAIVFNLENVGIQVDPSRWAGREVWDFSELNIAAYPAGMAPKFVPVGHHSSMERFNPLPIADRDIDVVFCGADHPRRAAVLEDLSERGFRVVHNVAEFGAARDRLLARSKLALNLRYYADGTFPVLRSAHLAANRIPMLSEEGPEMPDWVGMACPYEKLADVAAHMLRNIHLEMLAERVLQAFRASPMVLP